MTEREFATEVVARLQKAGHQALWAGGCVRDELLGLEPADYDIATEARPEQVKQLFRRCHSFGASFGVVEVLGPKLASGEWLKVQVATFRSDGTYSDGRRPDSVTFSSPEEDALRRDFTINGMFFDPVSKQVIDYVGGKADLELRLLRAIGNAYERFAEDKLRLMRAARMAARFELTIEPATLAAAVRMASEIRVVSPERIAEELRKMLANRHRERGLRLLRDFDLISPILPELMPAIEQNHGEAWDRIARMLGELPPPLWPMPGAVTFELAFAVVLHGLGRTTAEKIGRRLRLANTEIDRICWLVEHHAALLDAPNMRPSRLKPLLVHPGIGELLALHRAGATVERRSQHAYDFCDAMLRTTPPEELNPPPLLTGDALIAAGWKPGPKFRQVLDAIRDEQLDGTITTPEEAMRRAEEMNHR